MSYAILNHLENRGREGTVRRLMKWQYLVPTQTETRRADYIPWPAPHQATDQNLGSTGGLIVFIPWM